MKKIFNKDNLVYLLFVLAAIAIKMREYEPNLSAKEREEKMLENIKHIHDPGDRELFKYTPLQDFADIVYNQNISEIRKQIAANKYLLKYEDPKYSVNILGWAIQNGKYKSVKTLLELGCNPNDAGGGHNGVYFAALKSHRLLKLVLDYGGDPNKIFVPPLENQLYEFSSCEYPLLAAAGTSLDNFKLLIDHGAKVHIPESKYPIDFLKVHTHEPELSYYIFLYALKGGNFDIVKYALTLKDINLYFTYPNGECVSLYEVINSEYLDVPNSPLDKFFHPKEYRQINIIEQMLRDRGITK